MSEGDKQRPRVGVAAIISDENGRVVLGQRKGGHGSGWYPQLALAVLHILAQHILFLINNLTYIAI